jgi:hypothetical protein
MTTIEKEKVHIKVQSLDNDFKFTMSVCETRIGFAEVHWFFESGDRNCFESMILERSNDGISFYGIALYNTPINSSSETQEVQICNYYVDKVPTKNVDVFYRMRIQLRDKLIITTPPYLTHIV